MSDMVEALALLASQLENSVAGTQVDMGFSADSVTHGGSRQAIDKCVLAVPTMPRVAFSMLSCSDGVS